MHVDGGSHLEQEGTLIAGELKGLDQVGGHRLGVRPRPLEPSLRPVCGGSRPDSAAPANSSLRPPPRRTDPVPPLEVAELGGQFGLGRDEVRLEG